MSSPVRVGTYAPITSKITPVLFLPVRGIVQNLHVCLSPPPTNTADETEHRAEQESGGREKSIRMNYRGRDVFLEEQQTRASSLWSLLTFPLEARFGGDRSRIWRKEGKKNRWNVRVRNCQILPISERRLKKFLLFRSDDEELFLQIYEDPTFLKKGMEWKIWKMEIIYERIYSISIESLMTMIILRGWRIFWEFGDRGKGKLKCVSIIIDFQIRDLLFLRIIKGMGKFW